MTDQQLVCGIKRKDEKALDCLIDRYGGLIKSIVSFHLCDMYRDECINDILLSIWNNISKFNPNKNSLKNWIGAVCKYKCIDYKRKYYKEQFSQLDESIPSACNVESNLLKQEIKNDIESLLCALSPEDRKIFKKRYIYNETTEEISQSMNIKSSVIYNRLSRGRQKLKKSLLRSGKYEK